jgi:lysophospholipid acyltransferase (LPLAT)-like uncharacterized protein
MSSNDKVILFPNPKGANVAALHQRKLIIETAGNLSFKMSQRSWDKMTINDPELQVLSEFGETISFAPEVASRLIASLATNILRNRLDLHEEY